MLNIFIIGTLEATIVLCERVNDESLTLEQ